MIAPIPTPRRIVLPVPLDDFRPLLFTGNRHVQTILGAYWTGPRLRHPTRQQVLPLPDGDALMIYDNVPDGWHDGDRIVLLVHGLTGSHASPQLQRMTRHLLNLGVRVVRMDHRGTAGGLPLARQGYHGGRSEDIRAILAEVHNWAPQSPLSLHGTSLGGNMVLKLAGEAADNPVPGLDRVSALNPPIDMAACSFLLSSRANRHYDRHFAIHMVKDAEARRRHFPDLPLIHFPKSLSSRLFDDLYTAPRHGFADALDYYAQVSAAPLVPRSPIPTLLLTARDDPFIDAGTFEALRVPDHVQVVIVPRGGHIGYLGRDGNGGVRWAEHRLVLWLTAPRSE
jgi:predicted alpha/beta-fold hydrolase